MLEFKRVITENIFEGMRNLIRASDADQICDAEAKTYFEKEIDEYPEEVDEKMAEHIKLLWKSVSTSSRSSRKCQIFVR